MKTSLRELMATSGVAFGTSGARGLADAMTDLVCYAYTTGFLQHFESRGKPAPGSRAIAVAGDLRPSTGRIMEAVARAAEAMGYRVVWCGRIPSPALALFGLEGQIPAIMVTGSHIPEDRNGIKFNTPSGEILKEDEEGIARQVVAVDDALFDAAGRFAPLLRGPRHTGQNPLTPALSHPTCLPKPGPRQVGEGVRRAGEGDGAAGPTDCFHGSVARIESVEAGEQYIARYVDFSGSSALEGLRLGVYQHSAVGRDILARILEALGAQIILLGRSEVFIPVDTEAIRPEDVALAEQWAREDGYDALVSTDGDSDRPLLSDERGRWLRGDLAGILCARFLDADAVCTPVSCNTAVERCGWFREVRRTKIGSPYVIAAMNAASAEGGRRVVGYEANGGFLLNSHIERQGRTLRALPTRDAVLVILSILLLAKRQGRRVSELAAALPARFTASGRMKNVPPRKSAALLERFSTGSDAADGRELEAVFGALCGTVGTIDRTDGLRVTFGNGEILHVRASGNAPELRCYSEAGTEERAKRINGEALEILGSIVG